MRRSSAGPVRGGAARSAPRAGRSGHGAWAARKSLAIGPLVHFNLNMQPNHSSATIGFNPSMPAGASHSTPHTRAVLRNSICGGFSEFWLSAEAPCSPWPAVRILPASPASSRAIARSQALLAHGMAAAGSASRPGGAERVLLPSTYPVGYAPAVMPPRARPSVPAPAPAPSDPLSRRHWPRRN